MKKNKKIKKMKTKLPFDINYIVVKVDNKVYIITNK